MPALRPFVFNTVVIAFATFCLAACSEKAANTPPQGRMPPPEVGVVTIAPQRIAIVSELPGRIEAARIAQVRARVPGIVLQRVFREGSDVKAGDILFRIDPAPFEAAYNHAQAALTKAQANLAQAQLKVQRYAPLAATHAISTQDYDDALTAQQQAAADVASAQASRETARLNRSYATVTAPISGRIGRALVTEGALVGQGEATVLTTIQQLDPVYVNLTQSSTEVMRLRQAMTRGQLRRTGSEQASVALVLEDGQPYPHTGKLLFSDISVEESTGAVTLRAEFPNPERFLLPGMYARARLQQAINEQALMVPQQAVMRGPDGASVFVVGADGKVAAQSIQTGATQGNQWVISQGLQPGQRVIVEGLQKAKPGTSVKPMPWKANLPNPSSVQSATSSASK